MMMLSMKILRTALLLVASAFSIALHAAEPIPDKATILVLGGTDARSLTGGTGIGGILERSLRRGDPPRRWSFKYKSIGDDTIAEIGAGIAELLEKEQPDAVMLQVGQVDAWDSRAEAVVTPIAAYETNLVSAIEAATNAGVPVFLGTPLVIGELMGDENPANASLDAIAQLHAKVSAEQKIGLIDFRSPLSAWLSANNEKQVNKGLLTRDGENLKLDGWKLLEPAMLSGFGLIGSAGPAVAGQAVKGIKPEANSTVMVIGDSGSIDHIRVSDGWGNLIDDMRKAQWPEHVITFYVRHEKSGSEKFATAPELLQNVESDVLAIQPKMVVLAYGYTNCEYLDNGKDVPSVEEDLKGLLESVQKIRAAGLPVILLAPFGKTAAGKARAAEVSSALAAIAQATGSIVTPTAAFAQAAIENKVSNRSVKMHAYAQALALGIGLEPTIPE